MDGVGRETTVRFLVEDFESGHISAYGHLTILPAPLPDSSVRIQPGDGPGPGRRKSRLATDAGPLEAYKPTSGAKLDIDKSDLDLYASFMDAFSSIFDGLSIHEIRILEQQGWDWKDELSVSGHR